MLATLWLMQLKTVLAFFAPRAHHWLMVNLVSTKTPGPFLKSCFPANWPPACIGRRGYSSPGSGLCTSLYWTSWGSFLPNSSICWRLSFGQAQLLGASATSPSFARTVNSLKVNSVPSSVWTMKMINRTGPRIDPCGRSLGAGSQWDFETLITFLWVQQFNLLSVHLTVRFSSPHFISLSIRKLWRRVLKALVRSR